MAFPTLSFGRYAKPLSKFLVVVFQASLNSAVLPKDWEVSLVIPILKEGNPRLALNYRPISIPSPSFQLIEHIAADCITGFLNENNILSPLQHGLTKVFLTVTQLSTVIHSFVSILDKVRQVDVIFLDFLKAYDVLPHDRLIFILEFLSLPSFLISQVSVYLTGGNQHVVIVGHQSDSLPVTDGVPQGSVLAHYFFLFIVTA